MKNDDVAIIDKDAKIEALTIDKEEYLFKLGLYQRDAQKVKKIL